MKESQTAYTTNQISTNSQSSPPETITIKSIHPFHIQTLQHASFSHKCTQNSNSNNVVKLSQTLPFTFIFKPTNTFTTHSTFYILHITLYINQIPVIITKSG